MGGRGYGGEEGEYIPIATLSPPEWPAIKMGSDESHFYVSLIVRDKVTRPCPQTTKGERRAEAVSNRGLSALPLGQPGSLCRS